MRFHRLDQAYIIALIKTIQSEERSQAECRGPGLRLLLCNILQQLPSDIPLSYRSAVYYSEDYIRVWTAARSGRLVGAYFKGASTKLSPSHATRAFLVSNIHNA